jgi:hypothetical protein
MTTVTPEWTTVADAARRLGISDRHARRMAEKLPDQDRSKEIKGALRIRLSALTELWERESPSVSKIQAHNDAEAVVMEDAVSRARLEERLGAAEVMIVELKDDKQRLQEIIQREQENHRRLLDQLSEERRDQRLMHARSLPLFSPTTEPDAMDDEMLEDDLEPSPPVPSSEPLAPPEPLPLTFWQRLAHWISD